jgi:arylsulfatase A-like enzyme
MRERPNILVFMPDQLRADALGCFGSPVARTPNVDALAARGVRFRDAWVNHPVCSPSRVTMMTGWYPHVRGHRTLTHLVQPHEPNLMRYLRDAGYHVAFAGARGDVFAPGVTEASTDFCGWTVRPERGQMSMGPQYPEDSPLYHAFLHGRRGDEVWLDFDEAVTRTALEFLAAAPSEPWLLWMPMIFPHLPFEVEAPWYDDFDPAAMPAPVTPRPGKARFQAVLHERAHLDRLAPEDWREIARIYHAMTARVDDQFGRVLRALEQSGRLDDTLVVFLTDHGEYLGDFGLVEKWPAGLEPCLTRNPLVVAGPGVAEGKVCDALVEMVDLLPTCLELAGAEASHTHFGRSLVPLLADPDAPWSRTAAFTEGGFHTADAHLFEEPSGEYALKGALQREQPDLVGKCVAMRTKDWTYVHRLEEAPELYDRCADPAELDNLLPAGDVAHLERAARMRSELLDWHMTTSDVIPWAADPRFPRIPQGFRGE